MTSLKPTHLTPWTHLHLLTNSPNLNPNLHLLTNSPNLSPHYHLLPNSPSLSPYYHLLTNSPSLNPNIAYLTEWLTLKLRSATWVGFNKFKTDSGLVYQHHFIIA
jgi:hypothetical protein